MESSHNPIDDNIRRVLAEDEESLDFKAAAGEQGLLDMMLSVFHGHLWWLNVLALLFQLMFMGLTVWAGWSFFGATAVRDQILFATMFLWGVGTIGMFKIWFWMVMNRSSVIREVKRLELQVARLSREVESSRAP